MWIGVFMSVSFLVLALAIPVDGALRRLDGRAFILALALAVALVVVGFAGAAVLPKS